MRKTDQGELKKAVAITCVSGAGQPYVKVSFSELQGAQDFHAALIDAMRRPETDQAERAEPVEPAPSPDHKLAWVRQWGNGGLDVTFIDTPVPAQAVEATPEGWQTIDNAPDQGNIVVFGGWHIRPTIVPADGTWWRREKADGSRSVPTHWRHLPLAPNGASS